MAEQNFSAGQGRPLAGAQQGRFGLLFAALLLLLLSIPAVNLLVPASRPGTAHTVITIVFAVTLLSAVRAVSTSRKTVWIALLLAAPAILLQGADLMLQGRGWLIADYVAVLVFLGYTMGVVFCSLFRVDRVTVSTIYASLCVYLLLGVFSSIAFSLLDVLEPGRSFISNVGGDADTTEMRFGGGGTIFPLYFSFVTMTTLGYGDIIPNSPSARMFAAIEAILGQIYIAVLVARLVGLHIAHSTRGKQK
jgi:hypothetical protein